MSLLVDDAPARAGLAAAQTQFRRMADGLVHELVSGALDRTTFQSRFALEVRYLHALAGVLAAGGTSALTPSAQRLVRALTESQLTYLTRWMMSAAPPTPRVSEALLAARARLYAGAAATTYASVRTHTLGLPELPVMPGQGSSCMGNCACFWAIERGDAPGDWDCTWHRTAEESCPECVVRAQRFAPLRIRGGVIESYSLQGAVLR